MAKTIPVEVRQRIVEAFDQGDTREEIAEIYGVSLSSITRFLARRRNTGTLEPSPRPGRAPTLDENADKQIRGWIKEKSDLTLNELKERLEAIGYSVGLTAIFDKLKRLMLPRKKNLYAAERDRPSVRAQRTAWPKAMENVPVRKLVFMDESAASTSMTRLYGRGPAGERVVDSAPLGGWHSYTMLSAIRWDGPFAPLLLDGTLDGDAFAAWVEQTLIPELRPGDVVVMDNLPTHRVKAASRLLKESGHGLLYLPSYSPDMNPIEGMWSKIKNYLRDAKARTYDELLSAMGRVLKAITLGDCAGYFRYCGYPFNY